MERPDRGGPDATLVNNHVYFIAIIMYIVLYPSIVLSLHAQVCMDHGIVNYHIETVGTSRIEFTRQDYLTLLAARVYSYTSGTDVEFDLHEVVEGPPVSGCSSIASCFVLRMRHH